MWNPASTSVKEVDLENEKGLDIENKKDDSEDGGNA